MGVRQELLVDGVGRPCGEGDVRVAPVDPDTLGEVLIRLQVGSDQALFRSSTAPLVAFLDRTDKLVPLGQEGRSPTSTPTSMTRSTASSRSRAPADALSRLGGPVA